MPKENRSKYAILGMLDFCPMSGYDIRKYAVMSIGHFWKEDYGHIYPTLKLLLEEGMAKKDEMPGKGKPLRHLYSITSEGKEALARWLDEMPNPPNLRIELLLKVFLGHKAEPERLVIMLERQAKECESAHAELLATEKHLQSEIVGGGERGREAKFQLMTLRYGKSYYESLGTWCRETLEELRERP
ncbi:MAG: PadR family transcriptional regulator [Rectinemataceae bacterium]|jgi:DNA-binding PadR family transcriptional regulator